MRKVRIGLVQAKWEGDVSTDEAIQENMEKMIEKHEAFAAQASKQGVHILCFQDQWFGQESKQYISLSDPPYYRPVIYGPL